MYRASTPKHVFYFDIDPNKYFKNIDIVYTQDGVVVLQKKKDDLVFGIHERSCGNLYTASFYLTQEETKLFNPNRPTAEIQVRMLDQNDHILTSPIVKLRLQKVLNDEVLT
jgi:hypothetical protein